MDKQVKNLLKIIKFTPPIIILFACFFVVFIIYTEQKNELKREQNLIEKQFIKDEKRRIKSNINTIHNYIHNKKNKLEDELKIDIRQRINSVHDIAMNIYNKNKSTKTKSEILNQIKDSIETIRFNEGRGYFSIHTIDGINILHPINKPFEGTSVFHRKDSFGNYPVQEAIKIAKTKGEGFFSWYYYKPNDRTKEYKKIGIVKKFAPYNLIITTAEYLDDFNNSIQKKIIENINGLNYKNQNYIFIINFDGQIISHPNEKILGHNIFKEKKFEHVGKLYKGIISEKTKDYENFILIKPKVTEGENTEELKVTFVKRLDEWKWIISTSFKSSDAKTIIEQRKDILEKKYDGYKRDIIIYGIFSTILLLIASFLISKLLEKKFLEHKENLEKQIKENKTQKETLLKAQKIAKIGEYELDLDTKVAYWSDSMIKIFGVENCKDTPGPEFLKKIMYDEDWHCFDSSIQKCLDENIEHICRYRIKKPIDGKVIWIECRGQLTENNTLIGTVQDITQSKTLEIENHQKEELLYQQSKMAAMGEMIGNIAHQWRQPLSAISTAATGSKIQKEMDCLTDVQFNSAMDKINNSAQYLSQTIDDFRSFFNQNNTKTEFEISNIIAKALNLIDAQFTAKEINIIQNIEDYNLISLENELLQVLINILNNARDALVLKEKQKRFIFINTYKKNNNLYIEIIDNAGGIKEDIINRIFEPYFTTKHKSIGTGIGLYMSEEIIRKHLNGNLIVENYTFSYEDIEYKGAKFIIQITI